MTFFVMKLVFVYFIYFFFSSRRRHTRFSRDWSSDVCSSDLAPPDGVPIQEDPAFRPRPKLRRSATRAAFSPHIPCTPPPGGVARSEERRVGKEWRYRLTQYH